MHVYFHALHKIFLAFLLYSAIKCGMLTMKKRKGEDGMTNSTNLSIRMDTEIKAQAEALYGEMGMSLTTAINIFIRQSLRERCIPFDITLNTLNRDTLEAMSEAERIARDPKTKGYHDMQSLIRDLDA